MDQITIILDGIEVSGQPGSTILELANEVGVYIPTLCYDKHLSPLGACRICLVEDESSGRMLASCITPIASGMVINTKSERVLFHRRNIIELILASHPDSCIVCDKGNRCELRRIATELGVGLLTFEKIPFYQPVVELNPFIQRDMSKCIRCGRCIRADQEIAVVGAIDYTDRGFESRPATLLDVPLEQTECNFCGICISVCPTGALSERMRPSTLTASHVTRTTCTLCGTGCAILLETDNNKVLGAAPADDKDSVNIISLCVKGHYGMDFINSAGRLTEPLIRKNGDLAPATWEEALSLVAEKFTELKGSRGGQALGALGASHCTNEENYLLQKLVRLGFGSNNVDSGARLRSLALAAGIERILGTGAMTAPISEIRQADDILVIGADPLVESPIAGQMIKQAVKFENAHLTLVDILPRGLEQFAGSWIRPQPGTHAIFLAGLLREMISTGKCPEQESGSAASRLADQLMPWLKTYSLKMVEQATGIPVKLMKRTAARLASSPKLAVISGASLAYEDDAYVSGVLLAALALLSGAIGKPGCGLFPIAASCNDQGACDMGALPEKLPGNRDFDDPSAGAEFERVWGASLPPEKGLDYLAMLEAADSGKLAGLYVVVEDPVRDAPEAEKAKRALSKLDFLVVQDRFLSETAKLAHVVLPCSSFAEIDGTWTSIERRVQTLQRAIDPIAQSRPDWKILVELMSRLGLNAPYEKPNDVLQEINETVPIYGGITSRHLELESVFQPCDDPEHPGEAILFVDAPPKAPIDAPLDLPTLALPQTLKEHVFWLIVNDSIFHSCDQAASSNSRILRKASQEGMAKMNFFDAGPLGIEDGDVVFIRSATGSVKARLSLDSETPRGILLATNSSSFSPVMLFAMADRDLQFGTPRLNRIQVKVEAANERV